MYKRYYDGYGKVTRDSDPGEIIVPRRPENTYGNPESTDMAQTTDMPVSNEISVSENQRKNSLLGGLEIDDLLLVGVLIFLLMNNDGDDPLMPIIIGFILISELL